MLGLEPGSRLRPSRRWRRIHEVSFAAVDFDDGLQFSQTGLLHFVRDALRVGPVIERVPANLQSRRGGHQGARHRATSDGVAGDRDVPVDAGWREVAVAPGGFDADGHSDAIRNGVARDGEVAAAPRLQPPVLRRNKDGRHPATLQAIAADLAVARFDENTARPVETEAAILHGKAVPDAVSGTEDAPARDGHLAIEGDSECLAKPTAAFQARVQVLPGEKCPLVFEN